MTTKWHSLTWQTWNIQLHRLIMIQPWSELGPASLMFQAPSWQRGPIGGEEHGNIWWQQTGAGATPWENKCLKASLCPSCWAHCRPQQKQLLARWCFLASTAWNIASEASSVGGAPGGGVGDYFVRHFFWVVVVVPIWVGLCTLVARLWRKI